ncbi:MAG: hypothetical protein IJJ29_10405 [Solobacterium sp.]|nr:hypothetical protein [Solobacterium sp.]
MRITGNYRIADKNIRIISGYDRIHEMSRLYRYSGEPDLIIEISEEDLRKERDRADGQYSDAYLETLAVYRKIAEVMPSWDTLLIHGSAVCADGAGYLFTAKSGTGKSTHAGLWRKLLKERVQMINDDKPLLHIGKDAVTVYGTPWNGKHHLGGNISAPLKSICFLEQAADNHIVKLAKAEAYPLLLQQVYRPAEREMLMKTLQLLDILQERVSFYRLSCNMELSAAELSYSVMSGSK